MTEHPDRAVLVFDIGGSHVSCSSCEFPEFRLGPVVSAAYPPEGSLSAFIDLLDELGRTATGQFSGLEGADLAFPGPFDYPAGISLMQHKLPYLLGVDLRSALSNRWKWNPEQIRFVHDASAFLLGEICAGSGRGFSRVTGLTLGTGIGSAFAVDGKILTQNENIPPGGEIWNLPFLDGTLEEFVSARAIRSYYKMRTGKELEVVDLAQLTPTDVQAREAFAEFGTRLGQAIRLSVSEFAPQIIVLGGAISRSAKLFLPAATAELDGLQLEVRVSALMDRAPLVGAAVSWFNDVNAHDGQVPH